MVEQQSLQSGILRLLVCCTVLLTLVTTASGTMESPDGIPPVAQGHRSVLGNGRRVALHDSGRNGANGVSSKVPQEITRGIARATQALRSQLHEKRPDTELEFLPATDLLVRDLRGGETKTFFIDLDKGDGTALFGACDRNCKDLDFEILDPSGSSVAEDKQADAVPIALIVPKVSGKYSVVVTMQDCAVSSCTFGLQFFDVIHQAASPAERSDRSKWEDQVRSRLAEAQESVRTGFRAVGMETRPIMNPVVGALRQGQSWDPELSLNETGSFAVLAACDDDCNDLGVAVRSASGNDLTASGTVRNANAKTYAFLFSVEAAGAYRLHVIMKTCGNEPCALALQVVKIMGAEGDAPHEHRSASRGTCFAVSPDGKVMTALHVVQGHDHLEVKFADGTEAEAEIDSFSEANDVVVLQTRNKHTPNYLTFAKRQALSIGERVFTIGFPVPDLLGDSAKFTSGEVSALSGLHDEDSRLQTTTSLQPGSSGGPLVNNHGLVVGVVTAVAAPEAFSQMTGGALPQGINWAVKADYAANLVKSPPPARQVANRKQAVKLVEKAVCQVVAK